MSGRKVRIAVIGAGRMADVMGATLEQAANAEMEASIAGLFGEDGDLTGGAREMLADPRIDAIYIATRNRDHGRTALAAFGAGKAVLSEKPFAMSVAEAEQLVAMSKQTGLLYMEAVATPFLPAVAAAIDAAQAHRLGRLRRFEASFGYPVMRTRHPRLFGPDAGVLADRAVYPLMLALITMGPVLAAKYEVDRDAEGVDVAARFRLDHANGGMSELAVSFAAVLDNSLRIDGEGGSVEVAPPLLSARRLRFSTFPGRASRLWRRLRQNPAIRRMGDLGSRPTGDWHPHGRFPHVHEVEHFAALFHSGAIESPVITHEYMLAVARLVAEARRS